MTCKRIRQAGSVTVGHPDAIDAYARELAARGETFVVDYMSDEIRHDTSRHATIAGAEKMKGTTTYRT